MKRIDIAAALAASLLGLAGPSLGSEPEEVVIVNVQGLPPQVARQVQEYALKGPIELRRYLDRTNMIYGLRMEHVVRWPENAEEVAAVRQRNDPNVMVVVFKPKAE